MFLLPSLIQNCVSMLLYQDWESNAAKHVSLKDHLDNVTSLIIQWRKMELKYDTFHLLETFLKGCSKHFMSGL